jgi:nicotinate dehydrogenase subunit A
MRLNGGEVAVESWDPQQPLLYVLRNACGLNGPKFGCGLGQCGACTVHVDGRAVRSCMLPVANVEGKSVTTIEGLGSPERPDPLQAAFIAEQAAQCGYCTSGMIMQAKAIVRANPRATRDEIKRGLTGNLCKCGTHTRILNAVARLTSAAPAGRA